MKLYANTLEMPTVNENIELISHLKYKENKIILIHTVSATLQCFQNSLKTLRVVDEPCSKTKIGQTEFICDNSKYVVDDESYQIPKEHIVEEVVRKYYRLRPGALVDLVVETTHNDDIEKPLVYFSTKETSVSHGIEEDIISFLSALKITQI